jgi:putative redox protein
MQLLLVALAGCSVLDILLILAKQRQDVREMVIDVEGWRVEGTPAPFSQIHLHFTAHGMVEKDKLEYAVTLGITKYCSVEATLSREVKIEWTTAIVLDDKESGSSGGRSTLP